MLVMLQAIADLSAAVWRDKLQMFTQASFISWRNLYPFAGLSSELSAVKSDLKNFYSFRKTVWGRSECFQ
jgi:hypothetical protein